MEISVFLGVFRAKKSEKQPKMVKNEKNLKNKNQTIFHYAHRDLYTKFQVDILKNEKLVRV